MRDSYESAGVILERINAPNSEVLKKYTSFLAIGIHSIALIESYVCIQRRFTTKKLNVAVSGVAYFGRL